MVGVERVTDRDVRLEELAGRLLAGLLSNPAVVREIPSTRSVVALAALAVSAAREVTAATDRQRVRQ